MTTKTLPAETDQSPLFDEGLQHFRNGEYEDAIQVLKRSLHSDYNQADNHYYLGLSYHNSGQPLKAVDHYQVACALSPEKHEYWNNLAKVRTQLGRHDEALSAARQLRAISEPNNTNALMMLVADCIAPMQNFDINPQFVEEVTLCFHCDKVNTDRLTHIGQKLFLHQEIVKTLLQEFRGDKDADLKALLADSSQPWPAFNHPLFARMMARTILWHKDIEDVLAPLRGHLLKIIAEGQKDTLWNGSIVFVAALASQCFINEYVYSESEEETQRVEALQAHIEAQLADKALDVHELAILACYRPIHTLPFAEALRSLQSPALDDLLRLQLHEPLEEQHIKAEIPTLTSIDDEISLLVKEQYETNPYPRWVSTATGQAASMAEVMRYIYPHIDESVLPDDGPQSLLIAGCGTGKQSVEASLVFKNQDITAVDITASSLAYAIRKTKGYGIDNIRYGLGDILKLKELDQQFDSIHCGGVLHHMHDPMAGWRVLNDTLKPGGFMFVALYSEAARRSVKAARDYIEQNNIEATPGGIREFREIVKALPDGHPVKEVIVYQDFYSISQLRDLVFHVQEHRFTCLRLKKAIADLGLEFLGFQLQDDLVKTHYVQMFPDDPNAVSLDNWHEYEMKNPHTFKAMYQFWLRKPD